MTKPGKRGWKQTKFSAIIYFPTNISLTSFLSSFILFIHLINCITVHSFIWSIDVLNLCININLKAWAHRRWYSANHVDHIRYRQTRSRKSRLKPQEVCQEIQRILQGNPSHIQIGLNKDSIDFEKIKKAHLLILAAPKDRFTPTELDDLKKYVENGGNLLVLSHEGGDRKYSIFH